MVRKKSERGGRTTKRLVEWKMRGSIAVVICSKGGREGERGRVCL